MSFWVSHATSNKLRLFSYKFTNLIVSSLFHTTVDVQVTANAPNFPDIQLSESNPTLISPSDNLKLKATVRPNDANLELNWTIVDKTGNQIIHNLFYTNYFRQLNCNERNKRAQILSSLPEYTPKQNS